MRGLVLPVLLLVAAPLAAQQTIQYQCDPTGKCIPVSVPTTKPAPTVTVTVPASPSEPPSVTVTPPSTTPQFSFVTQAVYWNIAGHKEAATDIVGTMSVTPRWSVRSDNFDAPGPGIVVNTFGGQFCQPLGSTRLEACLNGGAGLVTSQAPNHAAFNGGASFNYDVDQSGRFGLQIGQIQAIHGGVSDGGVLTSNTYAVGVGIKIVP